METNNKLRKALEELMKFTCNSCERRLCEDDAEEEEGQRAPSPCSAIIRARNALSAPPRQCDIGTAEEQEERYKATGEVYHTSTLTNALAWAQMPYEAEEGGAE